MIDQSLIAFSDPSIQITFPNLVIQTSIVLQQDFIIKGTTGMAAERNTPLKVLVCEENIITLA